MKKRLLAMLLAVVMVCSLLPVTALAEESSTIEVGSNDNLQAALSGNYDVVELTDDIELTGGLEIKHNVTLKLNGYTLTVSANITLKDGASVTIDGTESGSGITSSAARMFGLADVTTLTLEGGTYNANRNFVVVDNGNASVNINGANVTWGDGTNDVFAKIGEKGTSLSIKDSKGSYAPSDIRSYEDDTGDSIEVKIGDYTVYDGSAYSYYDGWNDAYTAYGNTSGSAVISSITIDTANTITVKIDSDGDGTVEKEITTVSGSSIYIGEAPSGYGWSTDGTTIETTKNGYVTVNSTGGEITYAPIEDGYSVYVYGQVRDSEGTVLTINGKDSSGKTIDGVKIYGLPELTLNTTGKWFTIGKVVGATKEKPVNKTSHPLYTDNYSESVINEWIDRITLLGDGENDNPARSNSEALKSIDWAKIFHPNTLTATNQGANDYVASGNTWHLNGYFIAYTLDVKYYLDDGTEQTAYETDPVYVLEGTGWSAKEGNVTRTAYTEDTDGFYFTYPKTITVDDVNYVLDEGATLKATNEDLAPEAQLKSLSDNTMGSDVTVKLVYTEEEKSLSVTKEVDSTTAEVGDTLTYIITVENTGNVALSNITVTDTFEGAGSILVDTDTLPAGVSYADGSFSIKTLAANGGSVNIEYTYTVQPADAGKTITNSAVAKVKDDPDVTSEEGKTTIDVDKVKESGLSGTDTGTLSITKTVSGTGADEDGEFTFLITIPSAAKETYLYKVDNSNGSKKLTFDKNGEAEITIAAGSTVKISGLPLNAKYTVEELDSGDYTVTYTNASGKIKGSTKVTVNNYLSATTNLNTEDHYSYIIGYTDGTVQPEGNLTRAEAATIFFRLLTDDARETYWSQTNPYSDVNSDDWYNNAISTLYNMGIISGYTDGTFQPNEPITRAELTKIAVSFFTYAGSYSYHGEYTDIDGTEWYADFVAAATELGLINGYTDGTFQPENYITRAETCAIVNRTLGRNPDADHLLAKSVMNTWPDNSTTAWYYADIQEATNSHDYEWIVDDGETVEDWTAKLTDRDWAALEKSWSTAYSAPGGEVMG